MTREIKFKAYYKSKIWNVESIYIADEYVTLNDGSIYGETVRVRIRDVELLQYTGLKDTAGNDVYEGDILFDAHREEHIQVVFDEGCFVAKYLGTYQNLADVLADDDISIAGKIHENPELLEVESE